MGNAPGMPVAIDTDNPDLVVNDDGTTEVSYDVTFREPEIVKFRQGYKCLKCWEEYANAWPDKCRVCGYAIKQHQAADFAKHYGGEKWLGPSTSMSEEIDRLDWEHEKNLWEKHGGTGIIVPAFPKTKE